MKRQTLLLSILFSSLAELACADVSWEAPTQVAMNSDEEMALFNIMNILDVETEIATKSKVNADYVPGIVTVLRGEQLQAMGVEDVHAAMQYVPGANLVTNNYGRKGVTVRGIGGTFGSSNLKLMINGHAVNSNFSVAAPHLMNLPIEQVERIEVIRGPGSILYGEYAFSGVVNVITRSGDNEGFVGYGRYDSPVVGGVISGEVAEGVEASLNLSAKSTEGSRHISGLDKGGNTGTLNTTREFLNAFLNLKIDQTVIEAHYMQNGKGDHFGIGDRQAADFDGVVVTDELLKIGLTHPFQPLETLAAEWQLDYSYGGFDMDQIYEAPPGYLIYTNGRIADIRYREVRYDTNLEFVWEEWEKNRLLFGLHYADARIADVWQRLNYIPDSCYDYDQILSGKYEVVSCSTQTTKVQIPNAGGTFGIYTGSQNLVKEDAKRTISSLYLQDQYQFDEQLTLTIGGRFDRYSDMGDSTTPSLSLLYELDAENVLKAQYAEAFRPPSFNELYTMNNPVVNGNEALQGETIETSELSYIYKTGGHSLRSTLFYSQFDNLIYKSTTTSQYENSGEGWHRGIELEAERKINSSWKVDGNLSWIETHDKDYNRDLVGSPEWLGNINLSWQPHSEQTITAHLRLVGDRNRGSTDSRSELGGFETLDVAGSWQQVFSTDLELRAGVRNLFDEAVVYPAALSTYAGDYPQQGRTWWLRLARTF